MSTYERDPTTGNLTQISGKTPESELLTTILNAVYPVGHVMITQSSANYSDYLGGTWVKIGSGKTLVGVDTADTDFNTVNKTGGSKSVSSGGTSLQAGHLAAHTHGERSLTGGLSMHIQNATVADIDRFDTNSGIVTRIARSSNRAGTNQSIVWNSIRLDALTINATHTHDSVGSGTAHSHGGISTVSPYVTVFFWKRTA